MEHTLARFVRALRAAGVEISVAEAIDASRTLALVGLDQRAALQDALAVVLAKTAGQKTTFDKVFAQFFRAPGATARGPSKRAQHTPTGQRDVDSLLSLTDETQSAARAIAIERAVAAVGVDEIRFASQSAYFERRTLEALGIGPLEARRRARLLDGSAGGEAEAGVLDVAEGVLRRHARALIDQRFEVFGQAATDAFMADALAGRALADFTPSDLDEMKAIAQRMARRLAARHGGRHRVNRRGHLDIRRTLRANAGSEVPFKLVLKKRRPAKPRIVALCDVSGSVARHSRFLLLLLSALDGTAVDLRAFAFSNHLHDISVPLRDLQGDAAITAILRNSGSGSTDYGQTFVELRDQHWTLIDRRTTVLVLGDGRSNYTNPRLDIFKDMAERAKRVVWLCSEARGRWGTSDSCMLTFAPYCTHVSHCVTALDLERIVEDAMEAYS